MRASLYFKANDAVVTGTETFDTVIRVPDALAGVTVIQNTTSTQDIVLQTPGSGVNSLALSPGHFRDITLHPSTHLQLSAGVYVVRNFTANTNSTVDFAAGSAPTYLVVTGNFIWRGATNGAQGFIGIKAGVSAKVETFITGTIVAPGSAVVVDTAGDGPAMLGSIFATNIEVHQGKQIKHVPFTHPWTPALQ